MSVGSPLTALEIASGIVVGRTGRTGPDLASAGTPPLSPLAALESAVRPALQRPPCLVSFSGGMDSSLVLAVAVTLARREGLPEPVACTWRFRGAPRAEENASQDQVVEALRLRDWEVLSAEDDLDLVSSIARRALEAHGVRHPVNSHLHLPLIERAAGGSVLTGVGGDQVLMGWRAAQPVSAGRRAARFAYRALPTPLRYAHRSRRPNPLPWVQRHHVHRLLDAYRDEQRAEPHRPDRRALWHLTRRSLVLGAETLTDLASPAAVQLVNPLLDPRFVAGLARVVGTHAVRRDWLIAEILGPDYPAVVHRPRPKAHFLEVFFRDPTRELVQSWDGSGVDPSVVDVPALQRLWSQWPVPPGTAGLVQQVALATGRAAGHRPAAGGSTNHQERSS